MVVESPAVTNAAICEIMSCELSLMPIPALVRARACIRMVAPPAAMMGADVESSTSEKRV